MSEHGVRDSRWTPRTRGLSRPLPADHKITRNPNFNAERSSGISHDHTAGEPPASAPEPAPAAEAAPPPTTNTPESDGAVDAAPAADKPKPKRKKTTKKAS